MHVHDHEQLEHQQPGHGRDRAGHDEGVFGRAAAARRTDVLGPAGIVALQRVVGNRAAAGLVEDERSPVLDVVSSGGQALDEPVRRDMEARMGQDFSGVRVHTDGVADRAARSVSAHAYTVGSDIVFQRGVYDPSTPAGQTLLAHELTHVVQQRNGPVDGTATQAGFRVSDPGDRFEREAASNAERVMSGPAPSTTGDVAPPGSVQREAEDEEEVQTARDSSLPGVQREESDEAEEG